jgi:hypothetical protein
MKEEEGKKKTIINMRKKIKMKIEEKELQAR